MQQSDSSSYYQYYQSHSQNPNPNPSPNDPPYLNPSCFPSTFASAPPVSSNYSPSDSSAYTNPPTYPPYPQFTDYSPNPPNPNSLQPYNFPHLNPQPTPFYGYDQNQPALNYDHSNPNLLVSSISDSSASKYGNLYESGSNYGVYGDVGEQRQEIGSEFGYGDGVYQYNGGKVVPYGGRGSDSVSSSGVIFDDYGRPIGFNNGKEEKNRSGISVKVVKAIPKSETQEEDVGSGVQKFRVKLLSEGAGQSDMDVLSQIGLDGIRILDVATCRTLRIYPLETVTRCEVLDSYIFAFWAKSSIDIEPRRIRLKSNSYTTNNILDTVTAATFQIKEIGGRNKSSDAPKVTEQPSERKKGFSDWMNLMKPGNEEKDHWIPDEAVAKCTGCATGFGAFVRRHHCRNCGDIFCDKCTQGRIALTADEQDLPVRVCDRCMAEVTQRLTNVKETAGNVALQSHADLAKKLKEEMEKNRKTSTGMTSNGSGMRMKEVECPTCTVHLQVQVPAAGSETIECSVCQHPFLVSAH